jgi:type I restriction enzyme S subunit
MNGKLPDGWEEKTLDQISENLDSKRVPITKNKRKSGIYPYYGASGIVDYVDGYIFLNDYVP